jgi:polysaccharide export outer membrane protein
VHAQATGPAGSAGQADAFDLRPGDILRIGIWPDATLSGEFAVEETGLVYLPFLGAVQVVGMPLDLLRSRLREGYSEIMKEPVVTITPLFQVGVSGGVRRPGNYRITPTENIMDVILMAGGFAQRAKEDQVKIVRQGEVLQYNVERALEEAADLSALTLRSGDQVVVPLGSSFQFRYLLQGLTFVSTTILLIDRISN